jgi:phosphate starvation-inducible PhoH-like protein
MSRRRESTRAKRASRPNPREKRNNVINFTQATPLRKKKITLLPRNVIQETYIEALEDQTLPIIVSTGPAGTGKTYLASLAAIKALNEGLVDKIIITRPNRAVSGNDIGFLPGGITEKMDPWVRPILDVFKEFYSTKEIEDMIEHNKLEFSPLAYMRGRTFKNAFIIADEMQNTTLDEIKMILTRIGENCRMVVDGDQKQSDIGVNNGLSYFIGLIEKTSSNNIRLIEFKRQHVIRSEVVAEVLSLFEGS